jgi:mannose-P-dolichol utilization defect protein 1
VRAKSAEGLAAVSIELETWALAVHAAYGASVGLPFSAYGESTLLLAQTLVLLALVYRYSRASAARPAAVVAVLAGAAGALATGVLFGLFFLFHLLFLFCKRGNGT